MRVVFTFLSFVSLLCSERVINTSDAIEIQDGTIVSITGKIKQNFNKLVISDDKGQLEIIFKDYNSSLKDKDVEILGKLERNLFLNKIIVFSIKEK